MKRYRIIQGDAYYGCIPITVWMVQVYEEGLFSGKWKILKALIHTQGQKNYMIY